MDREELDGLARALNVKGDFASPQTTAETARALHIEYALRVGMQVIEKALGFARARKKKLMIFLSCGQESIVRACEGRPRVDQSVVNFLQKRNIPFVDGLKEFQVEITMAARSSPGLAALGLKVERLMDKATNGAGKQPKIRQPLTICTRLFCTLWGSITKNWPSAITASIGV